MLKIIFQVFSKKLLTASHLIIYKSDGQIQSNIEFNIEN